MIIRNLYYHLLTVTTDQAWYRQNDALTAIIENDSNETFTFGNSVYDLCLDRWNGVSWEFYTGVNGLDVITYLNPGETAEIDYMLGSQTDKPFPPGNYRVFSKGWVENGQRTSVWAYAEFTVDARAFIGKLIGEVP